MFNTRVLALCVLTNEHRVHIIVRSLEALDGYTGADVGEQVESPAEGKIQRYVALSD
jgi:hypothetical protein